MDKQDREALKEAENILENPSLTARISDTIGTPVGWAISKLPSGAKDAVSWATKKSLTTALKAAVLTMNKKPSSKPNRWLHHGAVVVTGGVGGFFGLSALAVELPISTGIMLRSIADIARSEGENIRSIETQLACLEVFALGGPKLSDDDSDSAYYMVRATLARAVSEAVEWIAEKGIIEEGAPAIVRLISGLAPRFGIVVSEKAVAQLIPAVGAAGGATINYLFMDHFQSVAKGHFTVRRLERKYGKELVQQEYMTISQEKNS